MGKEEENFTSKINNCKGGGRCADLFEEEILRLSKASEHIVITASLLVALVFVEEKWAGEYSWVHSQLKGTHKSLYN